MAGQGTGPINIYEVLRDRINEVRADIKELQKALGRRTKQGECNRVHDEVGKRLDEFRQELSELEAELTERVESVEGALREASAMTNEVVRAAVSAELNKANGHMKDAVVEELRKCREPSFWPQTLSEWAKTIAVVIAILGIGWTWIEGYGDARVVKQQQTETLKKMERIVNQMVRQAIPAKP